MARKASSAKTSGRLRSKSGTTKTGTRNPKTPGKKPTKPRRPRRRELISREQIAMLGGAAAAGYANASGIVSILPDLPLVGRVGAAGLGAVIVGRLMKSQLIEAAGWGALISSAAQAGQKLAERQSAPVPPMPQSTSGDFRDVAAFPSSAAVNALPTSQRPVAVDPAVLAGAADVLDAISSDDTSDDDVSGDDDDDVSGDDDEDVSGEDEE